MYRDRNDGKQFQSTLPTRGSDMDRGIYAVLRVISIHAPHEGERHKAAIRGMRNPIFQSTLPTRGSDLPLLPLDPPLPYISIHAPHEGERRLTKWLFVIKDAIFQSTLPTRGSDLSNTVSMAWILVLFQSTLPTRGSDASEHLFLSVSIDISIHAPHEGERLLCNRKP